MADTIRFLSYLRVGLAATQSHTPADSAAEEYALSVGGIRMAGRYRLYGPGDVVALEAGQVSRCFPPDGSRDHEPNLFAHLELKTADLPWRFTPGGPAAGRLRPWLVLVVVEAGERVKLVERGSRLPILSTPVSELPDLAESWAWAHGQVTVDATDDRDLERLYEAEPLRFLARLICPRRLQARRSYLACLVPAFDSGRQAGLAASFSDTSESSAATPPAPLSDAWSSDMDEVSLPVYHSWSFSCASRGDFEFLAELLRPQTAPEDLGLAQLDVRQPGLGLPGVASPVPMAGALCAAAAIRRMTAPPTPMQAALQDQLWSVVTEGVVMPMRSSDSDPIVAPPFYGAFQAGVQDDAPWQLALNNNPGHRAIAGLGAEVARRLQEDLAAAAWERLHDVDTLQRSLNRDALKQAANRRQRERLTSLAHADGQRYLVFARPLSATCVLGDRTFLRRLEETTDLPPQVSATTTARLAARVGKTRRRRLQSVPSGAGITGRCLVPEARPDFAAPPAAGLRTLARQMQPVDISSLKTVAGVAPQVDTQLLARHPGRRRDSGQGESRRFTGGRGMGNVFWNATEPVEFLRRRRRQLTRAAAGLGLGEDGPLPTRLRPRLEFTTPFGVALARLDPEFLLPKVGTVPRNTISVVAVNPAYIEAFLAGLNDAWSRELIWRELPASARATSMRRFWDCEDPGDQIPDLRQWRRSSALGDNATPLAGGDGLALLIKGRLLERYPDTLIYAVPGQWSDGERAPITAPSKAQRRWPDVVGELCPGVTYVIFFNLSVEAAGGTPLARVNTNAPGKAEPGWFFVLEEQPCAPRFGLDLAGPDTPAQADGWQELSWAHVTTTPATGSGARHLSLAPPLVRNPQRAAWGQSSAPMAWITLQTPYRVYIHGSSMVRADVGGKVS